MEKNSIPEDETSVMISLEERDRRYTLIRSMMKENNISALIVSSNAAYPGHVRYFSNYRPHSGYGYVFFLTKEILPFLFGAEFNNELLLRDGSRMLFSLSIPLRKSKRR